MSVLGIRDRVLTFDEARRLRLEDKCRNTEFLTYSIEPVAFNILGTSSSIVSKPGFVWCADARRFVDGGADTLRITSLPCEEH